MTRSVDLIVVGRVARLDGEAGFGWVEGLAIVDGRVAVAGPRHEVEALAGPATRRLVLADDEVALPSVTDAHVHLADAALAADEVDLEGSPSLADALTTIAQAHAMRLTAGDRDGWLLGHGWTLDHWTDRPSAADLERVAPGRPIALWAHDHHTRWLSEAALAALGIGRETAAPAGGSIGRLEDGRPDGLLYEHATRIGADAIPRPDGDAVAGAIERYAARLAGFGVTGVQDPGGTAPDPSLSGGFEVIRSLAIAGRLPLRVHAGIRDEQLEAAIAAGHRSGDGVQRPTGATIDARLAADRFRVGWLKLFGDGSIGSRTSAMLDPYDDAAERPGPAGPLGHLLETRERLTERVALAETAGIATMIHAIGDRAIRTALDAFAAVGPGRLAALPLSPRIEHAQVVAPGDIPRFAALGVVASMQPVQLRSDESTMRRALGARTDRAFPVASLAREGAAIAFGTDAPVEPPDPWPGLATAVARWAPEWGSGTPPSGRDEAVPLDRALRAVTIGPRASAHEALGGRLVPGAPADLVVIAAAALGSDRAATEILRVTRPRLTLLDGRERHRAGDYDR